MDGPEDAADLTTARELIAAAYRAAAALTRASHPAQAAAFMRAAEAFAPARGTEGRPAPPPPAGS